MGFLRRLFGGDAPGDPPAEDQMPPVDAAMVDADEAAYELEVLREEQQRLSDLARRQMRYADYAWTPLAQGGDRRADDEESAADAELPDGKPG
jgi:hypothetical protein